MGRNNLDLDTLLAVLKKFRVSAEVLIYRLRMLDLQGPLTGQDGVLVLVQERGEGELRVVALQSWGPLGNGRWPSEKLERNGRPLESLYLGEETAELLSKGTRFDGDIKVFWRKGVVVPCLLSVRPLFRNPLSIILAIRVSGYLEKTGS